MTFKSGLPPIHPGDFLSEALNWLNLQAAYDLKTTERAIGNRLRGVRRLAA